VLPGFLKSALEKEIFTAFWYTDAMPSNKSFQLICGFFSILMLGFVVFFVAGLVRMHG